MASSTSNAQRFINSLKPHEVNDFVTTIYASGGYDNLVNRRHVSSSLDVDKLATMKSLRPQDGAFLTKWMKCKIEKHRLNQPPRVHPVVMIRLIGKVWPKSVQDRFSTFCVSKSIDKLTLYPHHVVLRSSLGDRRLPLLGTKKMDKQASHLCDTKGCLSEDHLCIETKAVNYERGRCEGIDVTIYKNTAGEFLILQVDPCQHGKQHEKANGDFFKYSCRKIKAAFIDDDDLL